MFLQASRGEGGGQGGEPAGWKLQPLRHPIEEVTSRGCVVLWSPEGSQEGHPHSRVGRTQDRNTRRSISGAGSALPAALGLRRVRSFKFSLIWGLPGGPVAEMLHSQCRGPEFNPWSGSWIPHDATSEFTLFSRSVASNFCDPMICSLTPWTVACQVPLSMQFPRKKYWSGLPFPSPGDLPDPGIKPALPCLLHRRWIFFLLLSHLGRARVHMPQPKKKIPRAGTAK